MKITRSTLCCLMATVTVLGCGGDSGSPLDAYRSRLSANALGPAFAPGGDRIGYADAVAGESAVFVGDAQLRGGVRLSFGIWDFPPFWSPDGQWIAFDRDAGIGNIGDIYMIPSGGGEEVPIAISGATERIEGWLPDGSAILYLRNQQTWVGPIDGEEHYPLLDMEDDFFAVPSPDGTQVAYSRFDGNLRTIWLLDRETGEHHQLTEDGFEALSNNYAWSPDGRHFGFRTTSTGTGDIWVADATTRTVRQLTRHLGNDGSLQWRQGLWTWSPDGRWIAFVSDRGGQTDIWVVEADGNGAPIRVTDDSRREARLAWSPDGSRLIFNHASDELPLGIVETNGDNPHIFMTARLSDGPFRLSPDGTTVLFTSTRSGNQDVWSAPVAGGEPRRLTRSLLPDIAGRWSPDGRSIAFDSRRAGSQDIYTMSSDGENILALTSWPGVEILPQWSPDGSTIAFTSNHLATGTDIWTVPATGGEPTRITNHDAQIGGVQWSPDGRDLIFKTNPSPSDPRETLNRVSSDGGRVLELFEGDFGAAQRSAQWSPDGEALLLDIVEDGYRHLHVMPATGGTPRRLTDGEREWDRVGQWSVDGSEIVFLRQPFTTSRGVEDFIAAVSVADGTVRTVVRDSTKVMGFPGLSENAESALYVTTEAYIPVDEVRIAELLAEYGSEGN